MSYTGAQAKTNNALQQKIGLTCVISSIHASFLSTTLFRCCQPAIFGYSPTEPYVFC